jgi:CRISPR-associated exonuclease Cas4
MTIVFSEPEAVPVSYVRQYLFCPRVPWFKMVEAFEPPMPSWVEQGKRWHQKQPELQKKRQIQGLQTPYQHQPDAWVESRRYGLYGYADEVLHNSRQAVAVEYKHDKRPPSTAQKLQLIAYLLCLREQYPQHEIWGILYKGGGKKQYRVEIRPDDIERIKQVVQAIRANSQNHLLPESSAQAAQCDQCEYLRYCNDR